MTSGTKSNPDGVCQLVNSGLQCRAGALVEGYLLGHSTHLQPPCSNGQEKIQPLLLAGPSSQTLLQAKRNEERLRKGRREIDYCFP